MGDVKNFQHVLIDEFQDFSEPFNQLLQDSKRINSSFKTFAVGDNWQAINGFAGSKLEFFNDFHKFFKQPLKLELRKNYRSAEPVVAVSNALMIGTSPRSNALSGVAANTQRGEARLWDLKELVLTPQEEIIHETDKLTAALIRLIKQHFDKSRDVVLLSRANNVRNYSRISAYSQKVLSYFPAAQSNSLSFSTTHRYKGLEALAVIIIDAERYPLIHPNWKFQRIFGDNKHQITEEERRLFYVALTRAETVLDVVTKDLEESIFLEDIHERLTKFEWDTLPEFEYPDSGMLTVRVSNAFYIHEILKERGWRFTPGEDYWYKRTSESELEDFTRLERQDWFKHPVKVEVFSEKGEIVWEKEAFE